MQQRASISCNNCGGTAEFQSNLNAHLCQYCGSQFLAKGNDTANDKGYEKYEVYVPFKNSIDQVRDKIYEWLITPADSPTDILRNSGFLPIKKIFVPFYSIKGTYKGTYDIKDDSRKAVSTSVPIEGPYRCFGPAAASTDFQELFNESSIPGDAIPFERENAGNIDIAESLSVDEVWTDYGKLSVAGYVYSKLQDNDPTKEYDHRLQYDHTSVTTVYYPVWSVFYSYPVANHTIFIDDRTGNIIGTRPYSYAEPPTRKEVFKKYALIGLGVWFSLLLLVAAYRAFIGPTDKFNNILFSPPAETFWFVRGILTLIVLPSVAAVGFYSSIVRSYYKKQANIRRGDLDLIRAGRLPDKIHE